MNPKQETTEEEHEIMTLTFFKDWHEITKKHNLTKEQYGAVAYAMCEYCFYGKDTELKQTAGDVADVMFEMSKPYINKSNKNKTNGSKGGTNARGKSGAPLGNNNRTGKKKE